MNLNKRLTTIITFTLFLIGFVFSRGPEQITQELQVEQAIHTKVEVTLAKLLKPSEYVIIVNATMSEKPLSLKIKESMPLHISLEQRLSCPKKTFSLILRLNVQ